jgi:hypothetical protein
MSAFYTKGRSPGIGSAVLLAAWLLLSTGNAIAQEKHKYFFKAPPGATKYGQTQVLEVGDVPGHQMRLTETLSKYPGEAPVYAGVKVVEARGVRVSDYIGGSGTAQSYGVWTLENGDKIFARVTILTHTSVGADGGRRTSFTTVTTLTGGTGKFTGIRGTLRGSGFTDLKTGTSGTETQGEYWFEK